MLAARLDNEMVGCEVSNQNYAQVEKLRMMMVLTRWLAMCLNSVALILTSMLCCRQCNTGHNILQSCTAVLGELAGEELSWSNGGGTQ